MGKVTEALKKVMNKRGSQDNIDLELTRAYFSATAKEKHRGKRLGTSRLFGYLRILALAVAIFGGLIFLAAHFLSNRHLSFVISVNVEHLPDKGVPEKRANKSLMTKKTERPVFSALAGEIKPTVTTEKPVVKNSKVLYDFEENDEGWQIPSWETEKPDHVARGLKRSEVFASNGETSMELYTEFPGKRWSGALIEVQHFLDLDGYDGISTDIYLPHTAPAGLRGKIILTVGENWQFVEMSRGVKLEPGGWTTLTASLADDSTDWKRAKIDSSFREDIRKIAVRIESNMPAYSGPVYIDNIRVHAREN